MPVTYDRCDDDVYERVTRMIAKYHHELRDAEVSVQCLFARDRESDEPAVKAPGGWPAYAVIRRVPLKQRVAGFKDAEITIDERKWGELSEPQRDALIDHEISHLEVVYEGNGPGTPVSTDDWGRPKLRIRQHDWELSGFKSVSQRHPDAALEVLAARKFSDEFGPVLFGGVEVG